LTPVLIIRSLVSVLSTQKGGGAVSYTLNLLNSIETGAEIVGIDLSKPVSAEDRENLNSDFARYHVLIIRDQKLTPEQFIKAGEVFGEIMPHHRKSGNSTESSLIFEVRNKEIAPGKYYIVGETFHTDHSNDPVPPKATSLHTVTLPNRGGDTQFVNVHRAYDDLSEKMKQRIEKLVAAHVYVSKYSPRDLIKVDDESLKTLPAPALHSLVRIHPDNGRRFLYLNPVRMESIIGMSDEDSQALIKELMDHATQKKYEYRHQWKHGDMVIWDNRSVMHQANADYPMTEVRHLHRIMIKGQLHPTDIEARNAVTVTVNQRVPVKDLTTAH
jgi:taurine dioxygenase